MSVQVVDIMYFGVNYRFWREVTLTMLVQAVAIIMYLGLNCMFWMGPGWSLDRMAIFAPVSVLQLCTFPSVEPAHTNSYMNSYTPTGT